MDGASGCCGYFVKGFEKRQSGLYTGKPYKNINTFTKYNAQKELLQFYVQFQL